MPDTPLTSEAVPPAPETVAANEAAPHDVAPPEPEATPAQAETPPPAEEPAPPVPEAVVEETPAGAPVAPPGSEPELAPPAARREGGPDAEAAELEALEAEVGDEAEAEAEPSNKHWYVVKVQSGREESIKEAIEKRARIERLEEFFGRDEEGQLHILIPVERVTEMRKGKRVVKERKLYPGYLMTEVEFNDRILYLFRETPGVGDFVGGTLNRPPPPMPPHEVSKILGRKQGQEDKVKEGPVKPPVERGDRVKVRDGTFAGMEGEVKEVLETLNHLRVELTIFGRPVPVELEYWQVEPV